MKLTYFVLLLTVVFLLAVNVRKAPAQDDYYEENYLRNANFVYKKNIKTVLMHKEGFEMSDPVVLLNTDERLVFSFDDLDGDYKKYEYTIVHCNADWMESDLVPNEYLESFADDYIDDYSYSVNTIQKYTHYQEIIPNDVIRYRLSGNYLLKVYTEGNPDDVVLTHRFFVHEPKVNLPVRVKMSTNVSERNFKQELVFSVIPQGIQVVDPYREIFLTVQQNGRWDNAVTDLKPNMIVGTELKYDDVGKCVFDGGNDYRYFDMKSLRYNTFRVQSVEFDPQKGYQVYLHPDVVRNKNVYHYIQESINGNFFVKTEDMNYSETEAEYATVHFTLPYDMPLIQGNLYLMGKFTDWQFLKEAELYYDYNEAAYKAEFFLKQGFYNYQYLMLPNDSKVGQTGLVEGNFFETNNEYTFYVYFRARGSRYDRLVLVQKVLAHPE